MITLSSEFAGMNTVEQFLTVPMEDVILLPGCVTECDSFVPNITEDSGSVQNFYLLWALCDACAGEFLVHIHSEF